MSREPWYESNNPDRVARVLGGRLTLWTVAFVVVFGVIGIGLWAFSVITSDIKGQGDAVRTKNSGTNRVIAQERFEQLYAEVIAADQRIDVMAGAAAADPSTVNTTNLTGALTYCLSVVADYNAEARKYSARDFRATDLPPQIDLLDPTTDCKESSQ